jgi:hypothetical protein
MSYFYLVCNLLHYLVWDRGGGAERSSVEKAREREREIQVDRQAQSG